MTGRTSPRVSVLVCRGCCCGTAEKLPDVDHEDHLARLRSAVADRPAAALRTVDCLGPCERANVVVVRKGAQRWWFGEIREQSEIDELTGWIGDDSLDPPPALARHLMDGRSGEPLPGAPG